MLKKFISGLLILIVLTFSLLASCTNKTITPMQVTTSTLSTQTNSGIGDTGAVNIADQGQFLLNGQIFNFKRIDKWGDEVIDFEGVTFSPVISNTTVLAPIIYWFTIGFEDGQTEDLQYILYFNDVQNDGNLSISTTKHDNPRAGIMLGHKNGHAVMYLMVSE